jgi:hypothetical protein
MVSIRHDARALSGGRARRKVPALASSNTPRRCRVLEHRVKAEIHPIQLQSNPLDGDWPEIGRCHLEERRLRREARGARDGHGLTGTPTQDIRDSVGQARNHTGEVRVCCGRRNEDGADVRGIKPCVVKQQARIRGSDIVTDEGSHTMVEASHPAAARYHLRRKNLGATCRRNQEQCES